MKAYLNIEQAQEFQTLDFEGLETMKAQPNEAKIRRENWLKQRVGKFTASEIHRLMTCANKPNELPKGAETYVLEKVVEELTDTVPESWTSPQMQWGIDNEPKAIRRFIDEKNLGLKFTGENQKFVEYGKDAGGTPDGLGFRFGVEVKCPDSKTHFNYILNIKDAETLKEVKPEYYWQVQSLLLFTRKKFWYFVSFDPRFKDVEKQFHCVKIEQNEDDILFLQKRLELAEKQKRKMIFDFKDRKEQPQKATQHQFSNSLL